MRGHRSSHGQPPIFHWRTGLAYQWWRRIDWGSIAAGLSLLSFYAVLMLMIAAWWADWKPWW